MEHIEMVELLHSKAGVSISDAKNALERSEWDMLEAMILLENEGKVEKVTSESSSTGSENDQKYEVVAATAGGNAKENLNKARTGLWDHLSGVWKFLMSNSLIVRRKGEEIVVLPMALVLIDFLFAMKLSLTLLVAGLFLGCGYSIQGKNFNQSDKINQVMSEINDSFDHMMGGDSGKKE